MQEKVIEIDGTRYADITRDETTFRFFMDEDETVLSSIFENGQRVPVNMDAVPDDFWQRAARVLGAA